MGPGVLHSASPTELIVSELSMLSVSSEDWELDVAPSGESFNSKRTLEIEE